MDGCSVDMTDRGWEEGKKVDDVGIVGKTSGDMEHHSLYECVTMNY